jgi:hypothetical protein
MVGYKTGVRLAWSSAFDPNHTWTRVHHETVGGVTRFVALFCSTMDIDPAVVTLTRTLQHVVDYSVQPVCIKAEDSRIKGSLSLMSRLSPAIYNSQSAILLIFAVPVLVFDLCLQINLLMFLVYR